MTDYQDPQDLEYRIDSEGLDYFLTSYDSFRNISVAGVPVPGKLADLQDEYRMIRKAITDQLFQLYGIEAY